MTHHFALNDAQMLRKIKSYVQMNYLYKSTQL